MLKVLFVCTANLQRSPTAVDVFYELLEEKGKTAEVRSAGVDYFSETRVTKKLIEWADKIYVMEEEHKRFIILIAPESEKKIKILSIPDIYYRNDPELVKILKEKLIKEI